jgi:hypothetical protein
MLLVMCDRCDGIEREPFRLERLLPAIDDKLALTWIAEAIKDLQSEQAALHPDE